MTVLAVVSCNKLVYTWIDDYEKCPRSAYIASEPKSFTNNRRKKECQTSVTRIQVLPQSNIKQQQPSLH
jgi:hypothetical protein